MFSIRNYKTSDYAAVASLYKQGELYGGQFDLNRDSEERLARKIAEDPEAILICESGGKTVGTISLIEDTRTAWLFRFAVLKDANEKDVLTVLCDKALAILQSRGHSQVLVLAPVGNKDFEARYAALGFEKGTDYTCYFRNI
ncbi:MAG: GNAT family N-acetyltransferase [Parcubacteria group bacterium]|nr:GNAT family N-acetyltransferase [Parcubacteria group bacterium]